MTPIATEAWKYLRRLWLVCLLAFLPLHAHAQEKAPVEKPLTWDECVQEAAQHNPDIVAAIQTVVKSKAQIGISRSDYFPQLQGTAGYEASNSANNSTFNPDSPLEVDTGTRNQFQMGVTLDQNIFNGFRTGSTVQRSKALSDDAEANLTAVKSQISADLKTAFARLLFFQEQIAVAKRIVERREENVRFVNLKFEGGRENKGSVLRNNALFDQAKFNLSETERALNVAKRELSKVLGRDYSGNFQGLSVKGTFKTDFPKAAPDISVITAEHPDHLRADAQLRAGKSDVKIAKSIFFPSFDASASATRRKFVDGNSNTLWSAGVNLNYPFAIGGRDIFEVRSTRAEESRLSETLHSTDDKTALQLKQSYSDFQDAIENIRVQQNFLNSAEVRAEIARSQYANGLLSYQDWDLIENDLITNQRTILESLRDALIAEAVWEKAQGKGAIP